MKLRKKKTINKILNIHLNINPSKGKERIREAYEANPQGKEATLEAKQKYNLHLTKQIYCKKHPKTSFASTISKDTIEL